jgi:hypothetical protein
MIRVTKMGEFSPTGRFLTLGCGFIITEVAQISGLLFPRYELCMYVLILTKNGLATFFTSRSDHPGYDMEQWADFVAFISDVLRTVPGYFFTFLHFFTF